MRFERLARQAVDNKNDCVMVHRVTQQKRRANALTIRADRRGFSDHFDCKVKFIVLRCGSTDNTKRQIHEHQESDVSDKRTQWALDVMLGKCRLSNLRPPSPNASGTTATSKAIFLRSIFSLSLFSLVLAAGIVVWFTIKQSFL